MAARGNPLKRRRSIYLGPEQLLAQLELPIQPQVFRANRAEPESASPEEESANAADTRVTPTVWKTPPQRG